MNPDRVMLCFTTCPDHASAMQIGRELIERRLAACVSVLPAMTSLYRWLGETQEQSEVQLLIKTTKARLAELKIELPRMHPFDVPELIALGSADGLPAYLEWVIASCAGDPAAAGS